MANAMKEGMKSGGVSAAVGLRRNRLTRAIIQRPRMRHIAGIAT
jgi:hypothetical protein